MTTITPARPLRVVPARSGDQVRPWTRDLTAAALWLLLLWVTALWLLGGGLSVDTTGALLSSLGRITGLIASALLLVQVLLMARVPVIERAWGQDGLTRLHRVVGFTSFTLMLAHLALIALGYAADLGQSLWSTIVSLVLDYPGMLLATAGTAALVMVVVTSLRRVRRRLRYESWHLLHLYAYLGAGLALPHQLWTGADFLTSPVATVTWWSLYAVSLAAVLVYRVALPLWRSLRAPIRVSDVDTSDPTVVSVTVAGPGVERLDVRAGQFFQWRFLDGPGWTRAHPMSVSSAPDGHTLRFTAAVVGDGTARMRHLAPGTRVLLEGPYGRLHAGVRSRRKVLLMGSGIGVTPLRGLLEEIDASPGEITLIHRTHDRATAVLADELRAVASARGAAYVIVDGPRVTGRTSWLPDQAAYLSDEEALRQLVPDVAERDVFLCGNGDWIGAVKRALIRAGVPADAIHEEHFTI